MRKVYYSEVPVLLVTQGAIEAGLALCDFLLRSFAVT
jgi:hypothetical protein